MTSSIYCSLRYSAALKSAEISVKSSIMVGKKYQWQGFESIPSGCLLEQIVDLSNEMGFAYERSTKFFKDFHTHDRLMLILPRGTSVMEVRTKNPIHKHIVDYETVLYVPKGLEHDDEGISSIYDTTAYYPSEKLLQDATEKLHLTDAHVAKLKTECIKIQRSPLLETLAQAYFFERVVNQNNVDKEAIHFLGRRILEEALLATFFPENLRSLKGEHTPGDSNDSVSVRALRYIEANLFEPLDLESIAKASFASVSTLLRRFKDDNGITEDVHSLGRI
ncbi:hypothetical protein K2X05_02795 [bacterium]|nr:hypothetical protein [bacterium]